MKYESVIFFKNGDISEYSNKDISKKDFFSFLYPKIGVISNRDLFFIKKSYPKKIKKHLKSIIKEEIETLFPNQELESTCQIINQNESQFEVGIWLYSTKIKEELIKNGCSYIIPEPLVFYFDRPAVLIYQDSEIYVLIYIFENKILNFLTTKKLSKEIISLFSKGITNLNSVKWLFYVNEKIDIDEFFDNNIDVEQKALADYPLFLDFIKINRFRQFRIKKLTLQKLDVFFVLRVLIYIVLSLSLSFYLSNIAYDEKIAEIETKTDKLQSDKIEPYETSIVSKIRELQQKKQDPFYIILSLSKILPEGSIIKKMTIGEESMDVSISTSAPLLVLNNLYFEKCFSNVKLASQIIKEEGKFYLELKIGLKQCNFSAKN